MTCASAQRTFHLSEIDRIIVVGGGKAGMPMAARAAWNPGAAHLCGRGERQDGHTSVDRWQVRFEHRPVGS